MTSQTDAITEPRGVIEYRDVHKSFDVPVLAGIDLTVALGETFGIVGPSGCGKSVLLKTTVGLIKPDRGDVWINGQSVFRSPRPLVEDADVPSDDLALAVAKEALRRQVHGLDVTQLVDGDDAVDRAPKDGSKPRLALSKRFQRLLDVGGETPPLIGRVGRRMGIRFARQSAMALVGTGRRPFLARSLHPANGWPQTMRGRARPVSGADPGAWRGARNEARDRGPPRRG